MEVPDDDSDLLGKSVDEVNADLLHRDEIIKHGLIDELTVQHDTRSGCEDEEVNEFIAQSTARTRLKWLFRPDQLLEDTALSRTGRWARELPVLMGSGVGLSVALVRMVTAYDQFVRSNQLTAWRTAELAKRRAADHTMLRALTFGLSVGVKTTILATGCYTLPLVISAVQGRTTYWEYAVGWGASCFLFCVNRGRRQMLVAGAVAAVPGLAYGCLNMVATRRLGVTFEDMYREQVRALVKHKLHLTVPSLAAVE